MPLVAWGMRRFPRTGWALALIGIAASVWLYADVRSGGGGLVIGRPDAPWGPLEGAFVAFAHEDDYIHNGRKIPATFRRAAPPTGIQTGRGVCPCGEF